MKAYYKTDIGELRENNEDSFFVDERIGLFIVADGMGGHLGGEVASRMAVDIISSSIKASLETGGAPSIIINEALQRANNAIYRTGEEDVNLAGMGTTLVLALKNDDEVLIAHIGDSRAYLISENEIKQLTEDHSIVAEMVRAGGLTRQKSRSHHLRNILTRTLGGKEVVKADMASIKPAEGDFLLLCSDGLTDMITDAEIKNIVLLADNLQEACEELVSVANSNGGEDNITVILAGC